MKTLPVASLLGAMCLLIGCTTPAAKNTPPTSAASMGQLPTELEVLAAGWENNVNRISSVQAHMKVQLHHYQDIATDLDGNKYQDQLVDTFFWKQGTLMREDRSFNYTFGHQDGRVEYHMPFGEHIVPKAEYDETKMMRAYGTIAATYRVLGWDGVKYDYCDEGKTCSITRGFTDQDVSRASTWLASGGVFFGDTLKELVDGARRTPPPRCSVEDMGEGLYRVALGGDTWSTVCTIDSRRGCAVRSIKHTQDSGAGMHVLYEAEYSYIDSGGIWIMAEGKQTVYRPKTGQLDYSWAVQVDPGSLKLNEPIDPEVFTLDGFKMRKGTHIQNEITGEEFLYNDIPLDAELY